MQKSVRSSLHTMKTTLLFLLLRLYHTSAQSPASLIVFPSSSQFFEYDNVSLMCERSSSAEWTVWRYASGSKPELSSCFLGWGQQTSSGCLVKAIKPSDSGVYWCESKHRESSNIANITITNGGVILKSPAGPVTEGENVTLRCKPSQPNSLPAEFYRTNSSLSTEPAGHMTIHHVSQSHEGAYTCRVKNHESSPSWLLIKDDSDPAVLTVSPDSSQIFEYNNLNLSCGLNSSSAGWRITRVTTSDHKLSYCGTPKLGTPKWGTPIASGCLLQTAKKSDSAVYWCESATRQRSNSVNFTVHDGDVILQTPLLPLTEGENATLRCQTRTAHTLTYDFYKDGALVRREPEGHMTIQSVSKSDEGQYRCQVTGHGESPPSWLFVRDPNGTSSSSALSVTVIRSLVVPLPYFFCTVVALSSCRRRPTGSHLPVPMKTFSLREENEGLDQPYDDVIADVTTEHQF